MRGLLTDIAFAGRVLKKEPSFILVAILTLGLGIGANSIIFSFVNTLLLKPLPFRDLQNLVSLREESRLQSFTLLAVTPADYLDWKSETTAFEQLAAYQYRDCSLGQSLSVAGVPQRVLAARVSANFFSALDLQPAYGRAFVSEEEQPEHEDVTILSHGLWRRQFGGDLGILGRQIFVDQHPYMVVGIMPENFDFPLGGVELWTPLTLSAAERNERRTHSLIVMGRLRPGLSMAQALANVQSITRRLEHEYPQTNSGRGVKIVPLREQQGDFIKPFLLLMQIATIFVLGIACTNVANMQLARSTARSREVTIRTALGASRPRIIRLLLVESLILGLSGGALGIALAFWGVTALKQSLPPDVVKFVMGWKQIQVDWRVLLFALLIAAGSGILFGLSAALQCSRVNLNEGLNENNRGGSVRIQTRLRALLVVAEVVLALMMLVASLQMIRGFHALLDAYRGFSPDQVLTFRLNLPERKYATPRGIASFYDELLRNISSISGVASTSAVSNLPGSLRMNLSSEFRIEGAPEPIGSEIPWTDVQVVSADYFQSLRVRLQHGRTFAFQDGAESTPVVIISERMARQYWPNENPIGKRVKLVGWQGVGDWRSIVGVVDDVRQYWFERTSRPTLYIPVPQFPRRAAYVLVRNKDKQDLNSLISSVTAEVRRLDPNLPVYDIKPMQAVISESIAAVRISANLMAIFGIIALLLSALGVYGIMSYSVAHRQREFGVRLALGAPRSSLLRMILRHALILAGIGIAVGLPLAAGLGHALSGLVFGLPGLSLLLMGVCTASIVLIALLASYLPARTAMKVDPMISLRCE